MLVRFFFFFFFVMNGHKVFSMYVCMQCSRCVVFKQEGINFDLPQSCISIFSFRQNGTLVEIWGPIIQFFQRVIFPLMNSRIGIVVCAFLHCFISS